MHVKKVKCEAGVREVQGVTSKCKKITKNSIYMCSVTENKNDIACRKVCIQQGHCCLQTEGHCDHFWYIVRLSVISYLH